MAKGGIVQTGTHVLPLEQGDSEYFHNSTFFPHSDTFNLTLQKYQEEFQIKRGNFHLTTIKKLKGESNASFLHPLANFSFLSAYFVQII